MIDKIIDNMLNIPIKIEKKMGNRNAANLYSFLHTFIVSIAVNSTKFSKIRNYFSVLFY